MRGGVHLSSHAPHTATTNQTVGRQFSGLMWRKASGARHTRETTPGTAISPRERNRCGGPYLLKSDAALARGKRRITTAGCVVGARGGAQAPESEARGGFRPSEVLTVPMRANKAAV